MILLLILYIHFVATSPDSSLSRNVTTDLRNNDCTYRNMEESVFNMTPKILNNPENPEWLALDTTDLPALKREKRSPKKSEETWKNQADKRIGFVKEKALRLMAQAMYATQELIWPVEEVFKRFESHVPYRMAFIFMRIHTLNKEAKSIVHVLEAKRNSSEKWTPTQRIQLYWQLVRKNTDITYLVDYVNQRVPLGTEGVDTTLPPPTTRAPNTTHPASTTTHHGNPSQATTTTTPKKKPRLRTAYFRRNFKMPPGPGDNKIRTEIGLGKAQFARSVKRKVKRSTP